MATFYRVKDVHRYPDGERSFLRAFAVLEARQPKATLLAVEIADKGWYTYLVPWHWDAGTVVEGMRDGLGGLTPGQWFNRRIRSLPTVEVVE